MMSQLNKFADFSVWTMSQAISAGLASMLLLLSVPMGLMSGSGVISGITGGVVLMHLSLHGWTLLKGTIKQRITLLAVWLVAVILGGLVATALGFK